MVLWCHQGPSLTWPSIHCTLPVKDKKLLRHRHSNDSNVPPRNTQLGPTCKRYKEVKMRNEARKKNISLSLHVIPFHSSCFLAFVEKLIVISYGLNFQLPNARKLLAVLRRKTCIYIYTYMCHGRDMVCGLTCDNGNPYDGYINPYAHPQIQSES